MAGLGRRTFAPGEVLTASNVMNYLMDQSVMSFAGTAARGSAIGTAVSEGMVSYLADSNQVEVYDGSAWKTIAKTSGAILQVVNFTTTSQTVVSTNGSWQNTALAASITPTSATSKILILTSFSLQGLSSAEIRHTIFRGNNTGTNLASGGGFGRHDFPITYSESQYAHIVLDSPATTSAQLYTVALYKVAGGNATMSSNSSTSSIILIEVAA